MTRRVVWSLALLVFAAGPAWAQTYGPQPAAQGQRYPQNPQQQPAGAYATRPAAAQVPAQGGQPPAPRIASQPARPTGGPPPGIPAAQVPPAPQAPAWAVAMTPQEQQWLDQVLGFWETRSDKIKTYSCKFQCWKYDAFGPPDKARVYTEGAIKYAKPDKGLFRVEKLSVYQPPAKPGDPEYVAQDATLGEHWICDGKQIFQFDAPSRKVIVLPLPVEMQNKAIADGPLPFMFGAKAETIKARYWVRGLPQGGNGKYWLEAVPKSRQDAQNFSKVHIVLDEGDYLPEMLTVFEPNATDAKPFRKTYVFPKASRQATDDKVNALEFVQFWKIFEREFYEPKVPSGWKREVQSDIVSVIAPPANNPPPGNRPPQQAQQPAGPQKSFSPLPR